MESFKVKLFLKEVVIPSVAYFFECVPYRAVDKKQ